MRESFRYVTYCYAVQSWWYVTYFRETVSEMRNLKTCDKNRQDQKSWTAAFDSVTWKTSEVGKGHVISRFPIVWTFFSSAARVPQNVQNECYFLTCWDFTVFDLVDFERSGASCGTKTRKKHFVKPAKTCHWCQVERWWEMMEGLGLSPSTESCTELTARPCLSRTLYSPSSDFFNFFIVSCSFSGCFSRWWELLSPLIHRFDHSELFLWSTHQWLFEWDQHHKNVKQDLDPAGAR